MNPYQNRASAGQALATALSRYRNRNDIIVLGLPRGGVPVAREVARALQAPLDVLVVRKVGMPGQPELALGAVGSGGALVVNEELAGLVNLDVAELAAPELMEVKRREKLFRGNRPPVNLSDRTVVIVDDGSATGATMLVAARCARQANARRVVVALPVASSEACHKLAAEADDVVCLMTPAPFESVGEWYRDFTQTEDSEVAALLQGSSAEHAAQ